MAPLSPLSIDVRSYGRDSTTDSHGFAQIVLPLEGALAMEIGTRGGAIRRGDMAFVDTGMRHDQVNGQVSEQANRSFILDLDRQALAPRLRDELARGPYCALSPAANKLVDFMALMVTQHSASHETTQAMVDRWAPLLFDTLAGETPRARLRLAALLAAVEAEPGGQWTAASMARHVGVGVSRLHELFRHELNTTPRAWLSDLRLQRVREALCAGHLPIAELAYRFGYSDQSALTRAMRKATGLAPAAYRRQMQDGPPHGTLETGSKPA